MRSDMNWSTSCRIILLWSHDRHNSTKDGSWTYQTPLVRRRENGPHGWKKDKPHGSHFGVDLFVLGISLSVNTQKASRQV